jgi:hypothetical protein
MSLTIPPRPEGFHPAHPPPGYRKDYVSFAGTRKVITPRLQLIHTNGAAGQGSIEASKAWAERRTYNGTTTTLPTFQVDRDGDAAQFIDINRAQNACYKANGWAISYETADTGYKTDPTISAFTEAQCQALANGVAYCSMLYKIPLNYPTTWDGSGTASHTEPFAYPYWTNSNGKICPGQKKKAQVRDVIIPQARRIVAAWSGTPAPTPPSEEDDDIMYLANLADGNVVVVGSSVRPVSGEEIAKGGPFDDLVRLTPPPSSYWHQWLQAAAAEYTQRIGMG